MGYSWNSLLLVLLSPGLLEAVDALVVKCPRPNANETRPYCSCKPYNIKCDFQNKEDVVVTKELLAPNGDVKLENIYIRVANATSVNVRADFMEKLQEAPSFAFDIWYSNMVTFHPTPRAANTTKEQTSTFGGVGIKHCQIPEIPANFLRDRTRGALRISRSKVGVLRAGLLDNVKEMRYIAMDNSEVEEVEGSVAAEGYVTLSKKNIHYWTGFSLSNVTIGTLGRGAFNLTHKNDMELMFVQDCRVRQMGEGALSATGDYDVVIQSNVFRNLEKGAFKVKVTGSVYFRDNLMGAQGLDALGDLGCHNASSIQNNTILVSIPVHPVPGQPSTPFHASCGKPQLFMVMTPVKQILLVEDTRVAWVLGAILAVLGMIMVVGVTWFFRRSRPIFSIGRFSDLFKGRSHNASLENLPGNIELNIPREDPEEGTSVEDLDMECDLPQDVEQPLLDTGNAGSSIQSCDDAPSTASHHTHDSDTKIDEDLI